MIWFKHPNNLPNDKRLAALIDKEGSRGYGMYMYIIEMLCAQPDGRLNFGQLKIMARKGFPRRYMKKIILEYRLFTLCEEEEFESAIDFYSKEKANHLPNDLKTFAKTERAENKHKQLNISGDTKKTRLARVRGDKNREEEIKRKDDVVVPKRGDGDDGIFVENFSGISESCSNDISGSNASGSNNGTSAESSSTPGNSPLCNGTSAESSNPTPPDKGWEKQVDDLSKNRTFRELVCLKSGYSALLDKHFDAALEEFKGHIILLGKENKMDCREEVRSYFTYYTRAGRRTSHELRTRLLELDARRQAAAPPNPYRYEQLADGKRTYLGCPIPDDAPPRPDSTAFWMEETRSWASLRQPPASKRPKPRPD